MTESEDLSESEIELVDPVTELRVRLDQVDTDGRHLRQWTPKRRTRGWQPAHWCRPELPRG